MGKQGKAMRWTLRIAAVLAVLLLAYAIWPVAGFARLVSAIEARDGAALAKLVDFKALRKSLTEPIVAELLNEQTLIDLLTKGETSGSGGGAGVKIPAEFAPFSKSALQSGWQTWWSSEYGLGDYYIYLPPDKAPDKQFKVKLSLKEMQWKLAGIDLPQPMRLELAQQLIKRRTEKSE